MNDDEKAKYSMASHSSRSLNFQVEDVKNLSLYIKNVFANIKNIDYQLNKRKNNKSFMNSNEIINESENDDEVKPASSLVNPFSRNLLFKRYSTVLFSTSYSKDKIINQSLLNKTSITEDSGREHKDMIMMKNIPIQLGERLTQVNNKIMNKNETIEDEQSSHKANQHSLIQFHLKQKTLPYSNKEFHRLVNSQKISKKQSKTLLEDYISLNKKETIHRRNQRVKTHMTASLIQDQGKKLNNKSVKTHPFSLTTSSVSPNKKKTALITSAVIKPNATIGKSKYSTNNTEFNQPKPILSKPINKKPIARKETLQDIIKNKPIKDKEFAEMYLLYSEINKLNSTQDNQNSNGSHYDYFNELKTSYLIRNSDTYKMSSFSKAYLKDKTNLAILRIQKHWRQWKITKLIKSTSLNNPNHSDLIKRVKKYFYLEMLKKDKDFKEMLYYITKANECYNKCLNNNLFEKAKNIILNDFIIENSKGNINEYSNIINLNLQLNKKPVKVIRLNKKTTKN